MTKNNTTSSDPELNYKYHLTTAEEQLFNDNDVCNIFDKIYELKIDNQKSESSKFQELCNWIEDKF